MTAIEDIIATAPIQEMNRLGPDRAIEAHLVMATHLQALRAEIPRRLGTTGPERGLDLPEGVPTARDAAEKIMTMMMTMTMMTVTSAGPASHVPFPLATDHLRPRNGKNRVLATAHLEEGRDHHRPYPTVDPDLAAGTEICLERGSRSTVTATSLKGLTAVGAVTLGTMSRPNTAPNGRTDDVATVLPVRPFLNAWKSGRATRRQLSLCIIINLASRGQEAIYDSEQLAAARECSLLVADEDQLAVGVDILACGEPRRAGGALHRQIKREDFCIFHIGYKALMTGHKQQFTAKGQEKVKDGVTGESIRSLT